MRKLSKLTVGSADCPVLTESFSNELERRLWRAKEENKHFGWNLKHYCVTLIDGELWLVGYTKKDFAG